MSWCPLFPQITGSSVWDLPPHIFKSWISIISHKNHETHTWRGNAYTLAKQATISLEQAKEAMKVLSEPDERSLTKDHDGKRIISDDGENWFVVNSEKYQEMIKREIALENARARTAKWRKNKKSSTGNNGVEPAKTPMNPAAASTSEPKPDPFDLFWMVYPLKKGKAAAEKSFERALKKTTADAIYAAVAEQMGWEEWTKEDGKYIPYPATWLNQGCWSDEKKPGPDPRFVPGTDIAYFDNGRPADPDPFKKMREEILGPGVPLGAPDPKT